MQTLPCVQKRHITQTQGSLHFGRRLSFKEGESFFLYEKQSHIVQNPFLFFKTMHAQGQGPYAEHHMSYPNQPTFLVKQWTEVFINTCGCPLCCVSTQRRSYPHRIHSFSSSVNICFPRSHHCWRQENLSFKLIMFVW